MFKKFSITCLVVVVMLVTLRAIMAQSKVPFIKEIQHDLIPRDLEGAFPIEIPEYQGVEQLIVLSNRWVIVITDNIPEVIQKMDELTKGEYSRKAEIWGQSEKAGSPNWGAREYVLKQLETQWAEARAMADESKLDNTSYFSINSGNDNKYTQAKNPLRVTRYVASIGDGVITGKGGYGYPDIYYLQYSYLELPDPMQTGSNYTITLGDGKSVSFLYDEMKTVSRTIKINQVGYLPNESPKFAYLGGFLFEFGPLPLPDVQQFFVVSVDTGQVVFQGNAKMTAQNPRVAGGPNKPLFSGEDIYELDFSGLSHIGNVFISVPGVGRSWAFRHAPDVFGEAFYTATRGMYFQRAGMAIEAPYSAWTRRAMHVGPTGTVYESEYVPITPPMEAPKNYEAFDIIGATIDRSRPTKNATGGWYDAADWDRNITHYANLFALLYSYEFNPHKFFNGQLNIPKSSNTIPDILDEAEYGLLIWKKSMTEAGGVAGIVETWTHPKEDDPNFPYAFSQRTRWSSLIYAAAAAQFASLVRPFDEQKSTEYQESAKRAYAFGTNPENALRNIVIHAKRNRGQGEPYTFTFNERDEDIVPFLIHAKMRMFLLTNEESYLEGLTKLLSTTQYKPYQWPFGLQGYSHWNFISMFNPQIVPKIPVNLLNQWKKYYLDPANQFVQQSQQQPYHLSWPLDRDFWMEWGTSIMTNYAQPLLIAYHLTKDRKYFNTALQNINFNLGANPLGISWTTGLGFVYPIDIQHSNSRDDGIVDPIPGITIYGTTGSFPDQFRDFLWQTRKADGSFQVFMKKENWNLPLWRRWTPHPYYNVPQNEFTIHETMASGIFCYAMLLPDGWMPSDQLKNRKPRQNDLLFGYWYLP